jgi:PPOX class probable FMN-dependent enzyme
MEITTSTALRQLYAPAQQRALGKELRSLDGHCRNFIGLSPFLVISTCNPAYQLDASPRGGEPGFVRIDDQANLLIPDAPGNNRLDSLENIVATGQVGLLFMIPGFDETLRVNGAARLSVDASHIAICTTERRAPKLVICVTVAAAYLHCAKAFMRSKLWSPDALVDRSAMPTMGRMIREQSGLPIADETQAEMEQRYAKDL